MQAKGVELSGSDVVEESLWVVVVVVVGSEGWRERRRFVRKCAE